MLKNPMLSSLVKVLAFVFLALLFLVFLPKVFSGERELNPIIASIGPLSLRWYGVLIALGAFIAYLIVDWESKRKKISQGQMESIVLWVLVSGLIGARIGFAVQNLSYFREFPQEFFKFYHGGLSIHGALIGGIIALGICARKYRLPFIKIANIISPPVLLAIAVGRWGNFFNQEIIGKPASIPWKMFVSITNRPDGYESNSFFHPVFLYESIALIIVFSIYWKFLRNRNIGLTYTLCSYCLVRIVVEFWRIDYRPLFLKLDLAQIVSFAIILLTLVIYYLGRKYATKSRTA